MPRRLSSFFASIPEPNLPPHYRYSDEPKTDDLMARHGDTGCQERDRPWFHCRYGRPPQAWTLILTVPASGSGTSRSSSSKGPFGPGTWTTRILAMSKLRQTIALYRSVAQSIALADLAASHSAAIESYRQRPVPRVGIGPGLRREDREILRLSQSSESALEEAEAAARC